MINEHTVGTSVIKQKRICWSAILVGAFVGVGLGFLLQLFGAAIGLSAFTAQDGTIAIATGGLIGFLIGVIASMFVAGYAAGYLGRSWCPQRNLGILYGFTTWTVALLLSALLMGHVGKYVASYTDNLSTSVVIVNDSQPNHPTVTTDQDEVQAANDQATPVVTASTRDLAWSAFILFAAFFIGAFSSCLGAHYGMQCKRSVE